MKKLAILIGDLVHDTHVYNYGVPLNIGYITAAVKERFPTEVNIQMFKFPNDIIRALKENGAHILALSNQGWNVNLNQAVIRIAKEINPDILVVMGGPNIRNSNEGKRSFLIENSLVDVYIFSEGEDGFSELVDHCLGSNLDKIGAAIRQQGTAISNGAFLTDDKALVVGETPKAFFEEIIHLPSPWLTGLMDPFMRIPSYPLAPIIETNKNCPYQCTFCAWSTFDNKQVRLFELDVVLEELRYIFELAEYDFRLYVADANFGIRQRDSTIAEEIRRLSDNSSVRCTGITLEYSKDNLHRNAEIASILGNNFEPILAVQTFNEEVAGNSNRKLQKDEDIIQFNRKLSDEGIAVTTDLLVGLPGDTKQSQLESIRKSYDIGFHKTSNADIRLIPGSDLETDEQVRKWGLECKYRVIPTCYGEYGGHRVVEYEKCIRTTDHMSEDDFKYLRLFHGYLFVITYCEFGRPFLDFAHMKGFDIVELISGLIETPLKDDYQRLSQFVEFYRNYADHEWYGTVDDAQEHYLGDDVFGDLIENGLPKLNYDFGVRLLSDESLRREFVELVAFNLKRNLPNIEPTVIDDVAEFCYRRIHTYPLTVSNESLNVSSELGDLLRKYISDDMRISKKSGYLTIRFDDDQAKIDDLKDKIEKYGGSKNEFVALSTVMQIDNSCFVRALQHGKGTNQGVWPHATGSREELSLPGG